MIFSGKFAKSEMSKIASFSHHITSNMCPKLRIAIGIWWDASSRVFRTMTFLEFEINIMVIIEKICAVFEWQYFQSSYVSQSYVCSPNFMYSFCRAQKLLSAQRFFNALASKEQKLFNFEKNVPKTIPFFSPSEHAFK